MFLYYFYFHDGNESHYHDVLLDPHVVLLALTIVAIVLYTSNTTDTHGTGRNYSGSNSEVLQLRYGNLQLVSRLGSGTGARLR